MNYETAEIRPFLMDGEDWKLKKEQIVSLYQKGVENIEEIALLTATRPGYVNSVLQSAGLIFDYYDHYQTKSVPFGLAER
jgi:hypothetical protein